jgi:hypothetical protein
MEFTGPTLAAELKRQIDAKLPSRSLVGGGMHNFVIKASVASVVNNEIYFDAIGILLQQLVDDCPEWEIEFEGDLADMTFTFSR